MKTQFGIKSLKAFSSGTLTMLRWMHVAVISSIAVFAAADEPPIAPTRSPSSALNGNGATDQLSADSPQLQLDTGGFLGEIGELAFSADGKLLAAVGDRMVRLFDASSGTLVTTLRGELGHSAYGEPASVAFSPDGKHLLVGVYDEGPQGSLRIYQTGNLEEIQSLAKDQKTPCFNIAFSRDGRYLATGDQNGDINVWDWPKRSVIKTIPARFPTNARIQTLRFADAEPFLVSVDRNGTTIYRVPDGKRMTPGEYIPPRLLKWIRDDYSSGMKWPFSQPEAKPVVPTVLDLRLDSSTWAAVGMGRNGTVNQPWAAIWKAADNNDSPTPTVYTRHRWNVTAIAISPNNATVASGDKFGEIHIWDSTTAATTHRIIAQGESFYEAAFDSTGRKIGFGTQPDLSKWAINRYGVPSLMLDLNQKSIRKVVADEATSFLQESTKYKDLSIDVKPPSQGQFGDLLTLREGGKTLSSYRIPGGRKTSILTLLPDQALGVQHPVLFAADDGLVAMWDTSRDEMKRFFSGHTSLVTSIGVSRDSKIAVTSSTDRTIRIWSLLNHTPTGTFDFKYRNSEVTAIPPGSDSEKAGVQVGDQIISLDGIPLAAIYERMIQKTFHHKPGDSVTIEMRRGATNYSYKLRLAEGFDLVEPLISIFIGNGDQWIAWTPDGFYDCSPGADQFVGWHVNQGPARSAKFFRVQQFRKQLFRPDLIDQVMKTGMMANPESISQTARPNSPSPGNLRDRVQFDAAQPPICAFLSPKMMESFTDPRITIKGTIRSLNELPIQTVTLLQNGDPAEVLRPTSASDGKSMEFSHRLRLQPGRNVLSLIASNSQSSSAPEACRIVVNAPSSEEKRRVFALAIGVAEYVNAGKGMEALQFAADDAEAFADALGKQSNGKLYNEINVRCLTNEEATKATVLDGMQWLVDNVKDGDVAILYVSAHGFLDDRDNFYLGTHDVNTERLRATGVAWSDVLKLLHEELPACRRVVFIDACHSAGAANEILRNPLNDLASPELGTIFYASCTMQQKSFEKPEWKHGAFTKAILELLPDRTRDTSPQTGDGFISVSELAAGVTESVTILTGSRQTPVIYQPYTTDRINLLEFQGAE